MTKSRISNQTFYGNLLASGTMVDTSPRRRRRRRSFFELLAVLLIFGVLLALGFSQALTLMSN